MKHFTGLAHIALFTKDLKTSTAFYEALGGVVTDHADVEKPTGTNHILHRYDWCSCFRRYLRRSLLTCIRYHRYGLHLLWC